MLRGGFAGACELAGIVADRYQFAIKSVLITPVITSAEGERGMNRYRGVIEQQMRIAAQILMQWMVAAISNNRTMVRDVIKISAANSASVLPVTLCRFPDIAKSVIKQPPDSWGDLPALLGRRFLCCEGAGRPGEK